MSRQLVCLVIAVGIGIVLVEADEFRLRDETAVRHVLRFAGSGDRTLVIKNVSGSIRVTRSDEANVRLDVRRIVRADTREQLRRGIEATPLSIAEQRPSVEAVVRDASGGTCDEPSRRTVTRRRPLYNVEYDFAAQVPGATRLVLCTINGSAIEVVGTSGDFDLNNVNGRIELRDVRGSGSARTVNGRVEATLLDTPTRDSLFQTVNGSVVVTWPENFSADLRLKTMNGGLYTDFDVQPMPVAGESPSRRNGRFVYRSNNSASVRVGLGGPQVTLESLNGDVRVLRAAR